MCHPIEIKDSCNVVSGFKFGGPILRRGRRGRGEGTKGGGYCNFLLFLDREVLLKSSSGISFLRDKAINLY